MREYKSKLEHVSTVCRPHDRRQAPKFISDSGYDLAPHQYAISEHAARLGI